MLGAVWICTRVGMRPGTVAALEWVVSNIKCLYCYMIITT